MTRKPSHSDVTPALCVVLLLTQAICTEKKYGEALQRLLDIKNAENALLEKKLHYLQQAAFGNTLHKSSSSASLFGSPKTKKGSPHPRTNNLKSARGRY